MSQPTPCSNPDCSDGWLVTEMSVSTSTRTERWLDREPCPACRVHREGDEVGFEEVQLIDDNEE